MVDHATDMVEQLGSSGGTILLPNETPTPAPKRPTQLPEQKLILFALRLAVLEKIASWLGSLGFVWATVVLLGGFAASLETMDFWFVTVILVVDGVRIFSRSHHAVPELPYTRCVFVSRNVSWLEIASAFASIVSMIKLIKQDYGGKNLKPESTNLHSALTIFYSLLIVEALLFLVEKVYWEYMISVFKIIEKVNEECGLESFGTGSMRRFFDDAYSRCLNGNIFDGLKMDMVFFAMELLMSNSPDEQLTGIQILCRFSANQDYSVDTLHKIGMNMEIIERLVKMLNWRNKNQEDVRTSSAEILSRLASKKQNYLRVAGIPGAIESISSLLQSTRDSCQATDEIGEKSINESNLWTLNNLGLLILKRLARDHDNCEKIGKSKGLISKIIDFTYAEKRLLEDLDDSVVEPYKILAVKLSLKLLKKLVSTTPETGKNLRKTISGNVFTVSNIRETLHHGNKQPELQKLGAEILTLLALDEDETERIGGTGGVLRGLLCIFLNNEIPENQSGVRVSAGETIATLAQGSKSNCQRILRSNVLQELVEALKNPLIRLKAARILRNLCAYTDLFNEQHKYTITSAGATVLRAILSDESKTQEDMVGLAPHILKITSPKEVIWLFRGAGVREEELANELVNILKRYEQPIPKVPRIRRFAIELAIEMMKANSKIIKTFQKLGMKMEIETVFETTSELENFDICSGTVGLARHSSTINELIEEANELLLIEIIEVIPKEVPFFF